MKREDIKAEMIYIIIRENSLHCFKEGDKVIIKKRNLGYSIFSENRHVYTERLSDNKQQWVYVEDLEIAKNNIKKIT